MPIPELRITRNVLQTPLCEFVHPNTGSNINIVGTVHTANPSYYENIGSYIGERQEAGALVHYEMVRRSTPEDYKNSSVTAEEMTGLNRLSKSSTALMIETFGLIHQKDRIAYSESWENHDMAEHEIARLLGSDRLKKYAKKADEIEELIAIAPPRVLRTILKGSIRLSPLLSQVGGVSNGQDQRVIVGRRNVHALEAVGTALKPQPDRDITLLWGSGHVRGLGKGMHNMGYVLSATHWLGAFSLSQKNSA